MPILLDAVGTLIHPAQPVGQIYASYLEETTGFQVDPAEMQLAFLRTFAKSPQPVYSRAESGHATEQAWWRGLVARLIESLSAEQAALTELLCEAPRQRFGAFFDGLWAHYVQPCAWLLYPETKTFLEAASKLDSLLVVSNFDDRLRPILEGLGIADSFVDILTSADAKARKPASTLFERAFELLKCTPLECVHCGDSLEADLIGANQVGIFGFLLQRPHNDLNDFLAFHSLIGSESNPAPSPRSD